MTHLGNFPDNETQVAGHLPHKRATQLAPTHLGVWAKWVGLEVCGHPETNEGFDRFTPVTALWATFQDFMHDGILYNNYRSAPADPTYRDFAITLTGVLKGSNNSLWRPYQTRKGTIPTPAGYESPDAAKPAGATITGYHGLRVLEARWAHYTITAPFDIHHSSTLRRARLVRPRGWKPTVFKLANETYNIPMFRDWLTESGYKPTDDPTYWVPAAELFECFQRWSADPNSETANYWLTRKAYERSRIYPRDTLYKDASKGPRRVMAMVRAAHPELTTAYRIYDESPRRDTRVAGLSGLRGPGEVKFLSESAPLGKIA